MEALEHQKTVQNAAGGKPMKTSIDDFQMAISSTLPRVKANVKSLNAFLREATTLPTPATNYAVTQMKAGVMLSVVPSTCFLHPRYFPFSHSQRRLMASQ
ncbi:unnamed protein product [Schistocephalus solidus]|uniref:Elf4 domain-containing protein n=1 Tax=Schistocephalus solidus TaxID=70667 RepID=A0A183SP45_SCHSO|nr:unnamed protein product [Schistocephalus solidus]